MKKAIYVFITTLLLVSVLVFTGCKTDSSATPEDVACEYLYGSATMDFYKMDEYALIMCKQLIMSKIEERMEYFSITEAEAYAMYFEDEDLEEMSIENIPRTYSQFASTYKELMAKWLKEAYGENFSINVTVTSTKEMTEKDKDKVSEEALDEMGIIVDLSKSKGVKCTCEVYIKGSKGELTLYRTVYVVKADGAWKVLDFNTRGIPGVSS